jgi:magnesium-transporting ATPase (P-type)
MKKNKKNTPYQIEKKLLEERRIIRIAFIKFTLFVVLSFFLFLVFLFYTMIHSL